MSDPKRRVKKGNAPNKNRALRLSLFVKTAELIEQASRWCEARDQTWTQTYLSSALAVIKAIRELE